MSDGTTGRRGGRQIPAPLLDALLVGLAALAVRLVFAGSVAFPIPEDTAYYHGVARNVVEGRGLVSDALWSYVTPPLVLPRPAFEIWLPLPTLLVVPLATLFGTSFTVAQLVPIVAGTLVAVLAWRLAADVAAERRSAPGRARTVALGTGLAAAVSLPLVLHSALPDSTMLFALLALAACLLATRIVAAVDRVGARTDPEDPETGGHLAPGRLRIDDSPFRRCLQPLVVLGLLIGLAALTRNEAAFIGLAWALVVWRDRRTRGLELGTRIALVVVPALAATLVYAPWAVRDWLVFGSPLPGQAALNALSVKGEDIFAWSDPPTLARYLAQGPGAILEQRLVGLGHNAFAVLLLPSFPLGLIGLAGLAGPLRRSVALRPLLLFALAVFLVTSLVFPVSTTWGTFLHAAGPIHVLLLVGALVALDELLLAIGRRRRWERPTAWLGPTLAVATAGLLSLTLVGFGDQSRLVRDRFDALRLALPAAGIPVGPGAPPVITDFPIWYAEALRSPTLSLPDESPESVVSLARRFGARYLVLTGEEPRGRWPTLLEAGGSGTECFDPVELPGDATAPPTLPGGFSPIEKVRVWRIGCG